MCAERKSRKTTKGLQVKPKGPSCGQRKKNGEVTGTTTVEEVETYLQGTSEQAAGMGGGVKLWKSCS